MRNPLGPASTAVPLISDGVIGRARSCRAGVGQIGSEIDRRQTPASRVCQTRDAHTALGPLLASSTRTGTSAVPWYSRTWCNCCTIRRQYTHTMHALLRWPPPTPSLPLPLVVRKSDARLPTRTLPPGFVCRSPDPPNQSDRDIGIAVVPDAMRGEAEGILQTVAEWMTTSSVLHMPTVESLWVPILY